MDRRIEPWASTSGARTATARRHRRALCLLTDFHPERCLSLALRAHIAAVLPSIQFSLKESGDLDAIWVCGYEPSELERVRALRERHPDCLLLVTSGLRAGQHGWDGDVLAVGADHALEWPCSIQSLSDLLIEATRRASAN